jgi:hypothetical protein
LIVVEAGEQIQDEMISSGIPSRLDWRHGEVVIAINVGIGQLKSHSHPAFGIIELSNYKSGII